MHKLILTHIIGFDISKGIMNNKIILYFFGALAKTCV